MVAIEFVDDDDEDAIVEINIKANNARYNIERMYRNNGANWRYNFDATISECHEKADKIIAKQKRYKFI